MTGAEVAAPPPAEEASGETTAVGIASWFLALATFLGTVAAVGGVIGLHDVALADADLGVTLAGAALLAVAVTSLVAAYQLVLLSRRAHWTDGVRPACKPTILVALVLVLLLGIYVFLSGIRGVGDQRLVVVAVAGVLIAVPLAGLLAFGSEARVTLPRLGAIALAAVGAAVSASQFWYQNEYAPSQAGRAVALRAKLAHEGRQRDTDVIRATINFEAVSGRGLSVVGSAYTLSGARVVRCDRRDPVTASEVSKVFDRFLLDPQRSRFAADVRELQPSTVLAAGKFVSDGRRIEPDVPYAREIVLHVRRGRYQLLRFRAELFAISGAVRLSSDAAPTYRLGDDGYLYGFWRVDDDGWLGDLLFGPERWLVIRYELVREAGDVKAYSDVRVTARLTDPSWEQQQPSVPEAQSLFVARRLSDPAEPFAATELALGDVSVAAPGDTLPPACER